MNNLELEILDLIESRTEGDYWDFKEYHHDNKANLLHDIICMANNRADRDAYIIFGVRNSDYSIVGVERDSGRRNQQQMIDQLKDKNFAGGIRLTVYLKTLEIQGHEIDVLVVKNSTDTPFYVEEKIQDRGRVVNPYHIYTRVGDTNTDITKSADIDKVEYLWKKRFMLNKSPLEQIIKKLDNKEEWVSEDEIYYNKYNPEYTIKLVKDEEYAKSYEYYSYSMCNESTIYGVVEVRSYGTKLYSNQYVVLDSGRYITSVPKWEFIKFDYNRDNRYCLKYYIKTEIEYKLHKFLFDNSNEDAVYAHNNFMEGVVVFNDEMEKEDFMEYLYLNRKDFEERVEKLKDNYSYITCRTENEKREVIKRLNSNKVANALLKEFRTSKLHTINSDKAIL